MLKWQSALMSHLDETDSDSDRESALSGSFMVDSVMNDLKKRGYRNSSMYKGEEFALDPVAEATVEEMSVHDREHSMGVGRSMQQNRGYAGSGHRVPHHSGYSPHPGVVANGNAYIRPPVSTSVRNRSENDSFYEFDHLQGSSPSHLRHGHPSHSSRDLPTHPLQTNSYHVGYQGRNPSPSYPRPDSREGRLHNSHTDHQPQQPMNAHPNLSGSRGIVYAPPRNDSPQMMDNRFAKHAPVHTPPRQFSPVDAGHVHRRDEEMSARQRSQSAGRTVDEDNGSETQHTRSDSVSRSEGGTKKDLDLREVVGLLYSKDSSLVAYSASYLQHLAYGDDTMKMRIRDQGAIPLLIGLLRHPERKVQLAVLGALRNLSFGRMNDTNKMTISQDHGLHELVYQLRSSRSTEVRELVTGVLWNLSSCEHLKVQIIKASLMDVINYVLIRSSGWSPDLALNLDIQPQHVNWTQELCNTTGMLRNVSSAGEEARLSLRSAKGLIDTLLWLIRGCLGKEEANSKTIENVMCILRNLSYRVEGEIDPQEGSEDVLDKEWEKEQKLEMEEERRLAERHEQKVKKSTFSLCLKPATKESFVAAVTAREEAKRKEKNSHRGTKSFQLIKPKRSRAVYGTALLWQPDTTAHYVALLQDTTNPEAQEAACGALHNLTACAWKWAAYQRKTVRVCDGLPTIVSLIVSESDAVTRAAATALRNLSIDPLNKAIIGELAMHKLVTRLPFGSRHHNMTDQTTIAIICALIELVAESPENVRFFRQAGGAVLASRLARSTQYHTRILFAANKLCSLVYEDRDGRQILKKENWDLSLYNKMVKESGGHYDFEPRSTAKEFKVGRKGSRRKNKKEHPLQQEKKPSSSSKKSSNKKTVSGKRSSKDQLPASPTENPPSPAGDIGFYDAVDQRKPETSAPPISPIQYAAVSKNEQAGTTQKPESEPQQTLQPKISAEEAVNLYAQVDMDKKRAERKYSGQGRDMRRQQQQHQQQQHQQQQQQQRQQQHQQKQQQQQRQHLQHQQQLQHMSVPNPPPSADSWV